MDRELTLKGRTTHAARIEDESSLLAQARVGDPAALGAIYDRHAPEIYGYLYRCLGDREVAEDLCAEVFCRMLESLDRNAFAHTSLRAWLYRIAHNLAVDHCRKSPPLPVSLDEDAGLGDGLHGLLERKQAGERLRAALHSLTPDQQQVIVLRFGEGLKAGQVAEVLNKPERAIRALQHRALAALRRLLARDEL